jgi:hypothetical protein
MDATDLDEAIGDLDGHLWELIYMDPGATSKDETGDLMKE